MKGEESDEMTNTVSFKDSPVMLSCVEEERGDVSDSCVPVDSCTITMYSF